MKICSWDVGITHLAYCIMGYEPDDKIKFPIYGWKNINLINKKSLICNQPLKKKKKKKDKDKDTCITYCPKKAKYVVTIDDQEIGYCGSHKKNYIQNNTNDDKIFFINADKGKTCSDKIKKDNSDCTKNPSHYRLDESTGSKIYYCTIHKKKYDIDNDDNKIYKLIKESIYDKKYKCIYVNKNKKMCLKNAQYFDANELYCTTHVNKIKNKENYKPIKELQTDIRCVHNLKNKKLCGKNATYYKTQKDSQNLKDIFYCTTHKNSSLTTEKEDSVLQLVTKKKANKVSIDLVLKQLMIKLDEIPELLQVDKIIIENQPSLKNPKMKTVSSALYSYFLIRGIIDKNKTKSTIEAIKFISPSNKLKVDADNTLKVLSKAQNSDIKYKLTKSLGIKYCKQLIQHDINSIILFNKLTETDKPDDLCDAMLQGAYYLSIKSTK